MFGRLFVLFFLLVALLGNLLVSFEKGVNDVNFAIDASQQGETLGNKVSNINLWSLKSINENVSKNTEADTGFVEYIQLMTATGGNEDRDPFLNPLDRTVMDDYDFSAVISACGGILKLGAKPLIKIGNVPLKFCRNPVIGGFGVNVCPPDDYNQYYKYICDFCKALCGEFGLTEVRQWRFGVLTEYENDSWFYAGDRDPQKSFEAYCKLYDCTVAALTDTLGSEITVGAHSMTVTEGLWDEREFLMHCANGTNTFTGEKRTKIDYLSASFYDLAPGKYTDGLTLVNTIKHLRDAAESVGLNDLFYGIDEGRIFGGNTSGAADSQLALRICGYTYQAAYDARHLKQMIDNDIDYFSSWGYTTGGAFSGYPTVSCHVAAEFYKMVGSSLVSVSKSGSKLMKTETEAVAAYGGGALHIMAYNFKNDVECRRKADLDFHIRLPQLAGKKVTVRTALINDDANFFDEWCEDRKTCGITDDCFYWSPDDPGIDSTSTLQAQWARDYYFANLRDKYKTCAALTPTYAEAVVAEDGTLQISKTIECSNVVFITVTAAK